MRKKKYPSRNRQISELCAKFQILADREAVSPLPLEEDIQNQVDWDFLVVQELVKTVLPLQWVRFDPW